MLVRLVVVLCVCTTHCVRLRCTTHQQRHEYHTTCLGLETLAASNQLLSSGNMSDPIQLMKDPAEADVVEEELSESNGASEKTKQAEEGDIEELIQQVESIADDEAATVDDEDIYQDGRMYKTRYAQEKVFLEDDEIFETEETEDFGEDLPFDSTDDESCVMSEAGDIPEDMLGDGNCRELRTGSPLGGKDRYSTY